MTFCYSGYINAGVRRAALLLALLLANASLLAQSLQRGDVVFQPQVLASVDTTPRGPGQLSHFSADAERRQDLPPSVGTSQGVLASAAGRMLVVQGTTIALSLDGSTVADRIALPTNTNLGELVRNRAGDLFVAETSGSASGIAARLFRIDANGDVTATYQIPFARGFSPRGPAHIELLADQCTLLYTLGSDVLSVRRVFRYNVCAGRALSDFAALEGYVPYAGGIRQLPSGDVLVATGLDVRRFTSAGTQIASYPIPAVAIALTPDANGFWAVSPYELLRIDFERPVYIAARVRIPSPFYSGALGVVGEWRAGSAPARTRSVRSRS